MRFKNLLTYSFVTKFLSNHFDLKTILMMSSAQVVKTSVSVTIDSPSQNFTHPDDRTYVLFQLPYRLHAVLVHEGQASGGHYWAYIQDPKQQRWCKFNDITVSEVTWDEVAHESLGGYRHVSAYCLMYIDARREGCIGAGSAIQELPADLQELVDKDNAEFENEMRGWDEKQLNKAAAKG